MSAGPRGPAAGRDVDGPPAPDSERIEQMLASPRSRVWRDEETGALLVGLNDFFVPAADAEEIPPSELATVVAAWESLGWWGILAWVIQRRYVSPGAPAAAQLAPTDAMIAMVNRLFVLSSAVMGGGRGADCAVEWSQVDIIASDLRAALAQASDGPA